MKRFLFALVGIIATLFSFAQTNQQSAWFATFQTIKVAPTWSIHAELQVRSTDNWEQVQSYLPRVGLNYHIRKNQVFTAGYAFIPTRVSAGATSKLLGEHRIWQQYLINQPIGNSVIGHRFRLEERFTPKGQLTGGEVKLSNRVYSTRLRYFIRAVIPFTKQMPFEKGAFLGLQNEIFGNITDKQHVNTHFFDQNRAYAALGYRFCKKFDLEAGYMQQFIRGAVKTSNRTNNIVQLATYVRW